MRNPLIGRVNTTKKSMVDRTPIEPMPEEYVGDNNPYRGIEPHGVQPIYRPIPTPGYSGIIEVEYEPEPEELAPVAVRVVNTSPKFVRKARASTVTLQGMGEFGNATQLLPDDDSRTKVEITNTHASVTVYIGFDANVKSFAGGFPLAPGKSTTTNTQESIYVFFASGTDVTIGWLADYEIAESV